jgi:uncharacterized membrane protein SpoIIM required for sporulation
MVLEMIMTSRNATLNNWWKLLSIGAIYATLGILLAAWVFPQYASMVMVFLTVLAMAYLMHEIILKEEEYDEESGHVPYDIFVHHGQTLTVFMVLFFGMLIAYTFWYAVLPFSNTIESGVFANLDIRTVFEAQNDTVQRITGRLFTGAVIGLEEGLDWFMTILINNLGVLFFSFLFGLFYGYGAIFVLTWNASVIAAAAGSQFKQALAGGLVWYDKVLVFFSSWLAYMPHGVFEILGYFVGALAAGILGAGISRKVWRDSEKLNRVLADFVFFSVLSVLIIVVAAVIEVWITPGLI